MKLPENIYAVNEIPVLRREAERRVARQPCVLVQPTIVYPTDPGEQDLRFWFVAQSRNQKVVRQFIKGIRDGETVQPYAGQLSHKVLAAELLQVTPPNLHSGGFALRFVYRGFIADEEGCFYEMSELVVGVDTCEYQVMTQRGFGDWESAGPLDDTVVSIDSLLKLIAEVDGIWLASGTIDEGFQFLECTQLYANGQLLPCGKQPLTIWPSNVAC